MKSSFNFKKTALATVVAGTFAVAAIPAVEAAVLNVSWSGAFTMLNAGGAATNNSPSDYLYGYYANADGNIYNQSATPTAYGWKSKRTPVSGTMAFDTSSGAGIGSVNPFMFFGDVGGTGPNTNLASALGVSFQLIDSIGTIIGTMLFDWNGLAHKVSIVLDGSGFFGAVGSTFFDGGGNPIFTGTISGVGAVPASNTIKGSSVLLGPGPMSTKTLNTGGGVGCDGATIATQINRSTIVGVPAVIGACTTGMVDDGIGGSPMLSPAFSAWNANFDIRAIHLDAINAPVPVPAAVWLFGSGLVGLAAVARRKKKKA